MKESTLIEAIETKHLIEFRYKSKKRKAEVYCLGVGADGSLLCRCYETPTGGWKLFKVEQMESVMLLNQRFYLARSGYNRNGDKSMTEVLKQV
ncbi:MAG: WYL domain-containing protein [Crocinitomicaceae bacterium]|nr:WYL domain-containing protein [Crocinitomicaceae bacterium]